MSELLNTTDLRRTIGPMLETDFEEPIENIIKNIIHEFGFDSNLKMKEKVNKFIESNYADIRLNNRISCTSFLFDEIFDLFNDKARSVQNLPDKRLFVEYNDMGEGVRKVANLVMGYNRNRSDYGFIDIAGETVKMMKGERNRISNGQYDFSFFVATLVIGGAEVAKEGCDAFLSTI